MYPYNFGFVPPHSSGDPNQTNAPNQSVALVPTRSTAYGAGCVEYNQNQPDFMNILNQPLSWDPNQYGWNPNYNMRGFGLLQAFGLSQSEPDFISETQTETQSDEEEPENRTKPDATNECHIKQRNNQDPNDKNRATMG
ncbi:hypothetical protein HanIR_Chr06g0261771 [Helianthus annuus]|nr:hypothetical protein HanIR_Chr06g0261771 [Helianthus annuus]